jgi:hypothetical protein
MNRTTHALSVSLLVLACAGLSGQARAGESYDNCAGTIDELPAIIGTQGIWCLKGDLSTGMTSGYAIEVQANNVTIDCNGFKIGGLAAGSATETYGIVALERHNVSIRNCNIRGFIGGVAMIGGSGHVVEDNRFDNSTAGAIEIQGSGSVIRRNAAFDTGGSSAPSVKDAFVISTYGSVDILDNTIDGAFVVVGSDGRSVGIQSGGGFPGDNASATIANNRIRGLTADGSGAIAGILRGGSNGAAIVENQLFSTGHGTGITCAENDQDSVTGNIVLGFANGISNCPDDGNVIRGTTE